MKGSKNILLSVAVGVAVAIGWTGIASAVEKAQKPAIPEAQLAQMQKNATPGKSHQVLQPVIGKWTYTSTFWMKPGDAPQSSQGTSENTWILGGRFIKQEVRGSFNNQPFEGLGYVGHDNVAGKYQSTWMDNMMTGIMTGEGTYDVATRTVKSTGEFSCPMTGQKDMWYRSEWTINSNDKNIYASYSKDPSGKEFKNMEIVFTRVK